MTTPDLIARRRPAGPPAATVRPPDRGVGRDPSPRGERVSDHLRRFDGGWLEHRRAISALSLAASAAMGVVAAYQTGLIRKPPEPPLPQLDAASVDASGEAYAMLRTPDAALGLISYATTLALAGAGDATRSRRVPWLPLALLGKVLADAVSGIYLTLEQGTRHRRFCGWCVVASAASVAMVPLAVPEARAALGELRRRAR